MRSKAKGPTHYSPINTCESTGHTSNTLYHYRLGNRITDDNLQWNKQMENYFLGGSEFADSKGRFDATGFDREDLGHVAQEIKEFQEFREDCEQWKKDEKTKDIDEKEGK